MWYCITLVILSKKTSRIRSRIVKGLVSVSSRLLGVSVSVSSRRNFPMSQSRLGLEAERLGSRLGLGHEGLVSIPEVKPSNCFGRLETLSFTFHFDTSLSSFMMWNLQSYTTTVLNERMWHFRGRGSKHYAGWPFLCVFRGSGLQTPMIHAAGCDHHKL